MQCLTFNWLNLNPTFWFRRQVDSVEHTTISEVNSEDAVWRIAEFQGIGSDEGLNQSSTSPTSKETTFCEIGVETLTNKDIESLQIHLVERVTEQFLCSVCHIRLIPPCSKLHMILSENKLRLLDLGTLKIFLLSHPWLDT